MKSFKDIINEAIPYLMDNEMTTDDLLAQLGDALKAEGQMRWDTGLPIEEWAGWDDASDWLAGRGRSWDED